MEAVVRAIRGYEDPRDEHAEEDFENNREKLTPTEKLLMKKKTQLSGLFEIAKTWLPNCNFDYKPQE